MWKPALTLALGFAAAISPAAQRGAVRLAPGDRDFTLAHDGRRRSYLVHQPEKTGSDPLPVVVAFHGGGGNAAGFKDYAGLDAVADRAGFIVVYPDGTGPLRTRLLTFNAGNNCCGSAFQQKVDDVGFTAAILADLERRVRIDRTRIYATGHSNGAMMAYRLAAERADLIAAIVPVAGAMSLDRFAPSRPVPVLHVHSVDDPRALYEGGLGPPFPGTEHRVSHAPVEAGLGRWIERNGCRPEPRAVESRASREGHTATRLDYGPCTSGADVAFWKLTGAGHGWPGGRSASPERLIGPRTTVINAAEEIWTFVSRYRR